MVLLGNYLPPGRFTPDPAFITKVFAEDQKKSNHMNKLLLETWCHMWGMQANSTYFGFDILGLATARLTITGTAEDTAFDGPNSSDLRFCEFLRSPPMPRFCEFLRSADF